MATIGAVINLLVFVRCLVLGLGSSELASATGLFGALGALICVLVAVGFFAPAEGLTQQELTDSGSAKILGGFFTVTGVVAGVLLLVTA